MRTPATRSLHATALLLAVFVSPAAAQLDYLETEALRLVYFDPAETYLAPHAARCVENSLRSQREVLGYVPTEKISVLLSDFSDQGNAGAGTVPRNNVSLQIAPLDFAFEAVAGNERLNWIMNHELVHVAVMDQAAPGDLFFRRLFRGKVMPVAEHPETLLYFYLTTPRVAAPRWYQEGIAVFIETWLAGGRGRAQGSYDEMVFRSMVLDDSHFYDPLGLVSEGTKIDFQVEVNSYLYGTRFLSYLAYRYSPDDLIRWVTRTEGSKRYYSAQFREVFGRPLTEVWSDWVAFEHEFQEANLEAIREYPTTPYEDLSSRALGSVSRAFFDPDTRKIYAAFNFPGAVAHLGSVSIEDGSVERLLDIKGPLIYTVTSLAFDPESKTLFYSTDNHEYRDLRSFDPATGASQTLLKDARVGGLVFNQVDRSIWGIRHFNGIATLVRVPHPYTEWFQIHSWPYGEVIYDLDVSADGRLLSLSLGEISGRHTLRVLEIDALLDGEVDAVAEVEFTGTLPLGFVFSQDGNYLFGTSYYTGVANIFRYEIATDSWEAMSNCETGFFRPIPLGGDSLIVFRYTGEGFVPARIDAKPLEDASPIKYFGHEIVEKHPILKDWIAGEPNDVPLDSMITDSGEYKIVGSLGLESIFPVVEGYKDSAAAGFQINFSDPMSLNRLNLTASYTPDSSIPDDERWHLDFKYRRYDWWGSFKLNDADFYDLFGPTKKGLKGFSLGLGYDKTLIYDKPRKLTLNAETRYWGDLERLPNFQNVAATFDELLTAEVRLNFSNLRSSLGHVDDEKGHAWQLVAAGNHVNGETIPSVYGGFDLGLALPQGHSSVWLRTSAGFADGDRDDPFANFFFGGFGNNWVDHEGVKRYREHYAFPGVELNEIGGKNFAKAMLELNLPPLRFRRLGTPGFYASWARASLFTTGLATNLDTDSARRELWNVGTQVDVRFTVLSRLDLTLSFGYAVAFESDAVDRDEFMLSLAVFQ